MAGLALWALKPLMADQERLIVHRDATAPGRYGPHVQSAGSVTTRTRLTRPASTPKSGSCWGYLASTYRRSPAVTVGRSTSVPRTSSGVVLNIPPNSSQLDSPSSTPTALVATPPGVRLLFVCSLHVAHHWVEKPTIMAIVKRSMNPQLARSPNA